MKKVLALIIAAAMVLTFVACNDEDTTATGDGATTTAAS